MRDEEISIEAEKVFSLLSGLPYVPRPAFRFVRRNPVAASYEWNDQIDDPITERVDVVTGVQQRHDLRVTASKTSARQFVRQSPREVSVCRVLFPRRKNAAHLLTVW
jgi:hypothetical protein